MSTASSQTGAASQPAYVAKNWRDLIRPRKLEADTESLTNTYGKFTCEPLERGFGTTIGNGLRRMLLSSLQGAAITSVKIEGAVHEFTSLPEVAEDVTDIVLNLKEVIIRSLDGKQRTLRLDKDGEGKVMARDIQCPDGIEILNPDHLIMTCSWLCAGRAQQDADHGRGNCSHRCVVFTHSQGELCCYQCARGATD
jgi:DNA-directed RNA polymerase subunit alpha